MQAYATEELLSSLVRSGSRDLVSPARADDRRSGPAIEVAAIDGLLGRLADLVVERLVERAAPTAQAAQAEWLDARDAAAYLGIHRDTLRKLAAGREVSVHQDGPGCKLYFRRDELDEWRRSSRASRRRPRVVA